jgi:hypothetical protein
MFTITTDEHTARADFRVSAPPVVAEVSDYHTARETARALSASTSGRYIMVPPAGSLIRSESFANGVSEG